MSNVIQLRPTRPRDFMQLDADKAAIDHAIAQVEQGAAMLAAVTRRNPATLSKADLMKLGSAVTNIAASCEAAL